MDTISEQGLLSHVFSQLQCLSDFTMCSVVCRAWRDASRVARPTTIYISRCRRGKSSTLNGLLSFLQRWHNQGRLRQLQFLSLDIDSFDTRHGISSGAVQRFGQCVILTAGMLQLQQCNLKGCFDLATAISLLPKSLKRLRLCVSDKKLPSSPLSLSEFAAFTALQCLGIRLPGQGVFNLDNPFSIDYLDLFLCLQSATLVWCC